MTCVIRCNDMRNHLLGLLRSWREEIAHRPNRARILRAHLVDELKHHLWGEARGRRAEHLHAEGAMAAAQVHAHLWGEARGRRAEHPLASLLASELKSYLRISISISNLKPHLGISISISISNLKLHLGDARHKLLALLGVIELGLSVGSDVLG